MEMKSPERLVKTEIIVSKESFHDWRLAIASLREKKGMETVVVNLSDALVESASSLELHSDVVELYQERALSGQHMIMNELSKAEDLKNEQVISRGLEIMSEGVNNAHQYIEEHALDNMRPRSYRFLGRVEDYKGNFQAAAEHYSRAIPLFEGEQNFLIRVNRLEIQGFLAFSLIKSDRIKEGKELAEKTFREFNESQDGIELKEADYYTWAVWSSGIPIRVVGALIDQRALDDKSWAEQWMVQAEEILVVPTNDETWGDKNFEYRKDEIERVRKELARD